MSIKLRSQKIIINGIEQSIEPSALPGSPSHGYIAVDESDNKLKYWHQAKNRWIVIGDAEDTVFNNSSNGFTATNVQEAIEETSSSIINLTHIQFQRIGTLNSDLYLFSHTDQVGGLLSSSRPSGDTSNGYRYGNSAPAVCPFTGKIKKVLFVVQGVAVSTGSPSSDIIINCELWNVGFTNQGTKISDIDIAVPSASFTIGTWWNSSIDTNFTGSNQFDIDVTEGQLLGFKFNSTTGNGNAVALDNITVVLEIQKS